MSWFTENKKNSILKYNKYDEICTTQNATNAQWAMKVTSRQETENLQ